MARPGIRDVAKRHTKESTTVEYVVIHHLAMARDNCNSTINVPPPQKKNTHIKQQHINKVRTYLNGESIINTSVAR